MFQLPNEIQRHIYSFDPTYHEKYKKIIQNIIPIKRRVIQEYYKGTDYCLLEEDKNYFTTDTPFGIEEHFVETYEELVSYIKNTLWRFSYHFIKKHLCNLTEEEYDNLQSLEYDANEILLCLIKDFDYFMECYCKSVTTKIKINNTNYYVRIGV